MCQQNNLYVSLWLVALHIGNYKKVRYLNWESKLSRHCQCYDLQEGFEAKLTDIEVGFQGAQQKNASPFSGCVELHELSRYTAAQASKVISRRMFRVHTEFYLCIQRLKARMCTLLAKKTISN